MINEFQGKKIKKKKLFNLFNRKLFVGRRHDGGRVFTFVKSDKNANIKWGVRHYVPRKNNN